ncbi:MAG: Uma2 family endonuclease [Terricaulis sp.]
MNVVRKLMSADEFLEWRQDQPGRWELVSGTPVQMMAGAKQRHDRIVVNLIASLAGKLKGGPCRPWTADIAAKIPNGNVRQPDVTIDCGQVRDDALDSTAPTVVFEVLSPSTCTFDQVRKVDEYKRIESLRHIVLIDPQSPRIVLWSRADEGAAWSDVELSDLSGELDLAAAKVRLSAAEIYDGLTFGDPA